MVPKGNESNSRKVAESDNGGLQPYQGKSHKKRRRFPLCDFVGVHLERHLVSIHPGRAGTAQEHACLV